MHGGTLEQRAAHALAARRFRHRHAELRHAPLRVVAQVGEVAHAGQFQTLVVDAENLVVVEIDAVDVRLDDVIPHHLAETQQAVFLAQGKQVFEQARPVMRSKLAHQYGGTRRALRSFRFVDVVLGDDADGLAQFERVHDTVPVLIAPVSRGRQSGESERSRAQLSGLWRPDNADAASRKKSAKQRFATCPPRGGTVPAAVPPLTPETPLNNSRAKMRHQAAPAS
ncbi:iron-sulfur cluster co-chaperone protein HscB, mitochondrial-like protein [Corchorus olitorius]|uniref:Iron-sulfur cluster co-chaperone protein HscB, mitochondrial-like protein n=1 Tax=Corchorus olitorius TaxID=93759 RepID=A0A1R3L1N0_9ROSI|nr:iron-sulfur cluster co-chaperone protein HscB, mitochondrial-like protein [Corchorus olitorius]